MSEKPKTRAELEATIAELSASYGRMRQACADEVEKRKQAEARDQQTRAKFDDLKQRLVTAESDNQRMRGYLARVQEDDFVREELIKVGDPDGQHQLVPKRKPQMFQEPNPFLCVSGDAAGSSYSARAQNPKPKHWVTY